MEVEFNGKNLDDFFIKTAKGDEGMTETNAKIHVLADETLGGIKREYVEVGRDISARRMGGYVQFTETPNLEPTDIVHIDGPDGTTQRYELTDRKAEVGEKVVHVDKDCAESDGVVTEVTEVGVSMVDVSSYEASDGGSVCGLSHGYYRVLVPVEAAEDEPKPADPIDVIANLAQEVASLKRTVDRHRDEIDTLYKDNRTLGEELARLAVEVGKETESSAKALAEAFVALKRAGL
ncbi:hypothetical protein CJ467_14570 [Bacillus velezensis]|nr:hypothetical protein [Bacillus velezensis]PAK29618.1 hypothetical protein CJ467_14570 [Bacillus velezensis]